MSFFFNAQPTRLGPGSSVSVLDLTDVLTTFAFFRAFRMKDPTNTNQSVVTRWVGSTREWLLEWNSDGVSLNVLNAAGSGFGTATPAKMGRGGDWMSAAGTYDGSTLKAYHNGFSPGAGTGIGGNLRANTIPWTFGARALTDDATPMLGLVAGGAIWHAALRDEEIRSLHMGTSPLMIRPKDLRGYWPMSDGYGLEDVSGNATTLTAQSGTPIVMGEPPRPISFAIPMIERATRFIGPPPATFDQVQPLSVSPRYTGG